MRGATRRCTASVCMEILVECERDGKTISLLIVQARRLQECAMFLWILFVFLLKERFRFLAKILNRLRRIKHNEDTRAAQYLPFQLPTLRCMCVSRNWEFQAIILTSADINLYDTRSCRSKQNTYTE